MLAVSGGSADHGVMAPTCMPEPSACRERGRLGGEEGIGRWGGLQERRVKVEPECRGAAIVVHVGDQDLVVRDGSQVQDAGAAANRAVVARSQKLVVPPKDPET